LGTIKDITRRKISEQQLRESHSQLQVANEKLKVVGSLTRHDVRNKLSIVNTNLYLLKKQVMDNPLALKYITAIELATQQSDKIFEFTSQYEKIGLEKIADIDVGETFNQALRNAPEAAKISVANNAVGLIVRADSMLQQLFYNLIDNSLRHGERVTEINLRYEENPDCVKLVYEDNGVGVPDANKDRIFLGGFTTGHGSGLGLMIVKKMIETYGWKIIEEGEEDKGARFVMTIQK
jgi:signal transduction histidine kinase